jgi:hypothetical protein
VDLRGTGRREPVRPRSETHRAFDFDRMTASPSRLGRARHVATNWACLFVASAGERAAGLPHAVFDS